MAWWAWALLGWFPVSAAAAVLLGAVAAKTRDLDRAARARWDAFAAMPSGDRAEIFDLPSPAGHPPGAL